jgi:acyl carrier protein
MEKPMSQIENELRKLIKAKTGVEPQLDDTLDVMKIDSLAMAELTVEIEKIFDISIGEDILDVEDFRSLIAYVERKVPRCAGTSPD